MDDDGRAGGGGFLGSFLKSAIKDAGFELEKDGEESDFNESDDYDDDDDGEYSDDDGEYTDTEDEVAEAEAEAEAEANK